MFSRKCPFALGQIVILEEESKYSRNRGAAHGSRLFYFLGITFWVLQAGGPPQAHTCIRTNASFKTFKERGEWVELRFMTAALEHGFKVAKPWGDTGAYEPVLSGVAGFAKRMPERSRRIGVEHGPNYLRVQVKSTTVRTGTGYLCQFKPNFLKQQDYTTDQIDLFAADVIPENIWYFIPSFLLLGAKRRQAIMICPMVPLKKNRYGFESYKEAWPLLGKSRRALAAARSRR
jgi:hypothetical protein